MPRKRSRKPRGDGEGSGKRRGAREQINSARPQGARDAGQKERQRAQARAAEDRGEAGRDLPARRRASEPRGGYVMGIANPCRSCSLAVWVAGKDAGGKWIKVNLDGSPHVCGAQTMVGVGLGLDRYPMPLAAAHPMLPAETPSAPSPFPALPHGAHPVLDQGRGFVERFMVGVALVALLLLATFPRAPGTGGSTAADYLAQPASAQRDVGVPSIGVSAAAAGAPAQAARKDFFTMGSTEDDVMAVMGPPREIVDNRWWYGSSYVDFRNGRAVNFYNSIHGELKVKMQGVPRNRPTSLAKGITKDEVIHLQGTPTRLAGNRWYYGSSYVDFQDDRVSDYFNGVLKELKISAQPPAQ